MTVRHRSKPPTATRDDQDRLRSIVESLADGIVILDQSGVILFANPAAEELFGRALASLQGAELGFPSVVGDASEIDILRPGGASVTAELRVVDTCWDHQDVRLVSIRDVTDRKRAAERAEQLQRERVARAEAEAASQAKSDFLATMSHELRTPLNAVIGYADLLELGISGALTADQRAQVLRIRHSARHLLGLVNEVLDLSKVEAGRLAVQNESTRAAGVITTAQSLVHPQAEARGIVLGAHCENPEVMFHGDEDRVCQILVNLLTNAVKFTASGGQVGILCTTRERPEGGARLSGTGPWVCFVVTDTGVGIPADRMAAIFDPFVQVESGKTRPVEGTGLGLTISRRLARLMGGDLTVTSEQAKGSTFVLWLPEATQSQREQAQWRTEASGYAARLHGLSEVGHLLLRDLHPLTEAFVERLRDEELAPGAASLKSSQLADHVAAYVSDVALLLGAIEEARGQPSQLVADSAEIQKFIAERHGAQRARLAWTIKALYREWEILGEEIERVVRRGAKSVPERAVPEALLIIERLIEQAADQSARAFERSGQA
jgi:signal transduction histidine kinase